MQRLQFKVLREGARLPTRATDGSAGLDLYACNDVFISPGGRGYVETGVAVAIPDGFVGFVCPRSGLAAKHGVTVLNGPGVVDSDYRGEIGVILLNTGDKKFTVWRGDRVGQLVLLSAALPLAVEDVDLDDTSRGDGGFGSSGR